MTKLPKPTPQGPHAEVADLVVELLNSATAMHLIHLKVSGPGAYAAHKAMNEYYDAIVPLADEIAEQYQGATETILDYPQKPFAALASPDDALRHLRALDTQAGALHQKMPFTQIANLLDEVKSLISATRYKLRFLQ